MRTIVDIPESDLKRLDRIARREKVSRAEVVRRAVAAYFVVPGGADDAFGLWKDWPVDGVEQQRKLRREWERDPGA